ncbi:CUE domain-containing protein 2 [Hyalella azteca]|uniref:CUE domain-containing protein 2 n=1 Tax=Hyalella azteca TaxID=294128 RepID=A0A8B7NWD2_HYAAZ|nr:CUE domain-containing protein 2 [Hyalella azteca]
MAADTEFVFSSLKELVILYAPEADLSGLDDIVVNYVLGVVEDEVAGEPADVEGVKQLVEAYEPSFSDVPDHEIGEWIINTGKALKQRRNKGEKTPGVTLDAIVSAFTCEAKTKSRIPSTSEINSVIERATPDGKVRKCSSSSCSTSSTSDVDTLLELFPDACRVDAERCLLTSGGDVQEAITLMLDAPPLNSRISSIETAVSKATARKLMDDEAVKASIINKYGFIDHNEDLKEHKPVLPKWLRASVVWCSYEHLLPGAAREM